MIQIKETFKNLIPPLSNEEFLQLETNCLNDGIRDKIIVWNNFIIDGHNRYEIANKHNLNYDVLSKEFNNENEVIEWIILNQMGRRNLTEEQKSYLRGKRYENEKIKQGTNNQYVKSENTQNGDFQPTHSKLANEYNVSKNTILRDAEFSKGVDLISNIQPELKTEILQGISDLTKQEIQSISKVQKDAEIIVKNNNILIDENELQIEIEKKANELAEQKLKEIEFEKKNRYAKVAAKIVTNEIQTQAKINEIITELFKPKLNDVYIIEGKNKHKLIISDCNNIEFVKSKINNIDCVLTDPPYGISYKSPSGSGFANRGNYDIIDNDDIEFNPDILFKYSNNVITWGANYYANKLINSAGWLVWDKRDGKQINNNSDCELAWTNMINSARLFHHTWNGMIKASEQTEKRVHPTQKPIRLFEWCLEITNAGQNIIDLYAGSGTTLLACENTNRNCILVEKNITYAGVILNRMQEKGFKVYGS